MYMWFQYRILTRILGTNDLLCKLKMSQSHVCRLCGEHPESIRHLSIYKFKILETFIDFNNIVFFSIQFSKFCVVCLF